MLAWVAACSWVDSIRRCWNFWWYNCVLQCRIASFSTATDTLWGNALFFDLWTFDIRGTRKSFGQEVNCVCAGTLGEDLWKRYRHLQLIGVVCQKQMLTWCTAVSCKLCFHSSICSYQLYSRLNVEMEQISPWYLRKCYGYVKQLLSMIESYWTLRSKSFRLCRDVCLRVSLSMAAAVQLASFSCMPGSCLHLKGILASWSRFLTLL